MIQIKDICYDYGYTHAGVFHADDVFATALLRLIDPAFPIIRGYDPHGVDPAEGTALIYDIGEGQFDHHQSDHEIRPSGVPYASFGLLWRELYPQLGLNEKQGKHMDNVFVSIIDLTDNTNKTDTISSLIAGLNPKWDNQTVYEFDSQFWKAVDIATPLLWGQINQELANARAAEAVLDIYKEKPDVVITLPQYIPYNILARTQVYAVIYPSPRGGWAVAAVKDTHGRHKWLFPEELRMGNAAQGLLPGLQFCHTAGFMAVFDTEQQAVEHSKKLVEAYMAEQLKKVLNAPTPESLIFLNHGG